MDEIGANCEDNMLEKPPTVREAKAYSSKVRETKAYSPKVRETKAYLNG